MQDLGQLQATLIRSLAYLVNRLLAIKGCLIARNYWKKINLIDHKKVDSILIQFRNSQSNNSFNNEVNELKEFLKEIYNITKQPINKIEDAKNFYNSYKNKGYSLTDLADKFVNGGV